MTFTRELILTGGHICILDESDYERVSKFQWYALKRCNRFFAARRAGKTTLYLARALLDAKPNQVVVYQDGNSLNCTRSNLRLVTRSQYAMNRGVQANNSSGFKGVSWKKQAKPAGKWQAVIYANGKRHFLGYYDEGDILTAAAVYDVAAVRYHQDFARLNLGLE